MNEDDDIEYAMLKEDFDALPDEAHASRMHWVKERGDFKPALVSGRRTIPTMQDRT